MILGVDQANSDTWRKKGGQILRFADLELFVRVVQEGTFSAAARVLGLTQPAVSARIAYLERELNTTLLIREPRRMYPTPEGKILYEHGLRALGELHAAQQRIQEESQRPSGSFVMCAGEASGTTLAPLLLASFRRLHPEVVPKLRVGSVAGNLQQVLEHQAGLAIVPYPPMEPRIEAVELARDEFRLIVPEGHPLAQDDPVDPQELVKYPFLTREKGSRANALIEQALGQVGVRFADVTVAMEMANSEALKLAVSEGVGVAFIPQLCLHRPGDDRAGFRPVRVRGLRIQRGFYLIRSANVAHPYVERLFWQHCQDLQMLQEMARRYELELPGWAQAAR